MARHITLGCVMRFLAQCARPIGIETHEGISGGAASARQADRRQRGAVVVLRGDARHRRQRDRHHGGTPTMRADLALGAADVQWAVNAYLVVSAACIVLGGDASDRFGARRVAIVGLVLFAAASAIIALSASGAMLLTGRALQGFASALAVPSTLAALGTVIPPERRAAAMGAWTGFLMLGFSIGPLFGGAVTHLVGWRVIFWLNIAMMALATAGMAAGADGARAARPIRAAPTGAASCCWPPS